jgi:hypothetical protein
MYVYLGTWSARRPLIWSVFEEWNAGLARIPEVNRALERVYCGATRVAVSDRTGYPCATSTTQKINTEKFHGDWNCWRRRYQQCYGPDCSWKLRAAGVRMLFTKTTSLPSFFWRRMVRRQACESERSTLACVISSLQTAFQEDMLDGGAPL